MEMSMGLGVFGFWMFLAAIVVAGIWFDARKRESQQETLRRVVESGQSLDPAVIDKMINAGAEHERTDRDLKVAGIIVMFVAPGLVVVGWGLSKFNENIFTLMLGVSGLVGLVGIGLYVSGRLHEQWQSEDKA
jgi:hypothetical protein